MQFLPIARPGAKKSRPAGWTGREMQQFCKPFSVEQAVVDGADGAVGLLAVDDAGDLDLAGGDHMDVDVVVGQRLEHTGGHAAVALHTGAHDGHLGVVVGAGHLAELLALPQGAQRDGRVALGAGEDHVLLAVAAGGLQDDVHVDLLLGQHPEDLKAHARLDRKSVV